MKKNRLFLALFLTATLGIGLAGIAQQAEDSAIDPVCGMTVKKSEAKATFDHKGTTYYFCNEGCKEAFVRDPEKYLQKKEAAVVESGTPPRRGKQMPMAGTCPMMRLRSGQGPMAGPGAGMDCPFLLKDVEIKTENLPDGAAVKFTAKDPETVKKIQEHLKNMKGCWCPGCGQTQPGVEK